MNKKITIIPQVNIEKEHITEPIIYNNSIAIIDFLNLARRNIENRDEARFESVNDLIQQTTFIAQNISNMVHSIHKIYIVTKYFKIQDLSHQEIMQVILWTFVSVLPNWVNRIFLVSVNGINNMDIEADDRALFFLNTELSKICKLYNIFILSCDKFDTLNYHYYRDVDLKFTFICKLGDHWKNTKFTTIKHGKCRIDYNSLPNIYWISRPNDGSYDKFTVSN